MSRKHPASISSKAWMYWNQAELLLMAKEKEGRALLRIPDDIPEIVAIRPASITGMAAEGQLVSVFRTAPTHSRRIATYHKEFGKLRDFVQNRQYRELKKQAGLLGMPLMAGGSTLVEHPDPVPEVDSHDGYVSREPTAELIDVISDGAGNAIDHFATVVRIEIRGSASVSDQFRRCKRIQVLFKTSAIGTDSLTSATLSLWGVAENTALGDDTSVNSKLHVIVANPTSDTEPTNSDYEAMAHTVSKGNTDTQSTIDFTDTVYEDITLSDIDNIIIKDGITKLGCIYGFDLDQTITGITYVSNARFFMEFSTADQPGESEDPKLTVGHEAAGGRRRAILVA